MPYYQCNDTFSDGVQKAMPPFTYRVINDNDNDIANDSVDKCMSFGVCCKHVNPDPEFDCDGSRQPPPDHCDAADASDDRCGVRNPDGVEFQLANAKNREAKFGEFPWMVAVMQKLSDESKWTYLSGASLIHPSVVLSTAHQITVLYPSPEHLKSLQSTCSCTH